MIKSLLNSFYPLKLFINYIFKKTLGEFVKNEIDFNNLNIALTKGAKFELINLELDTYAINNKLLKGNIKIIEGNISSCSICYDKKNKKISINIDSIFVNLIISNENKTANANSNKKIVKINKFQSNTQSERSLILNLIATCMSNFEINIELLSLKLNHNEPGMYLINNPSFILFFNKIYFGNDSEAKNTPMEETPETPDNEQFLDLTSTNEQEDEAYLENNNTFDEIRNKFYNNTSLKISYVILKLYRETEFDYASYKNKFTQSIFHMITDKDNIICLGKEESEAVEVKINEIIADNKKTVNFQIKTTQFDMILQPTQIQLLQLFLLNISKSKQIDEEKEELKENKNEEKNKEVSIAIAIEIDNIQVVLLKNNTELPKIFTKINSNSADNNFSYFEDDFIILNINTFELNTLNRLLVNAYSIDLTYSQFEKKISKNLKNSILSKITSSNNQSNGNNGNSMYYSIITDIKDKQSNIFESIMESSEYNNNEYNKHITDNDFLSTFYPILNITEFQIMKNTSLIISIKSINVQFSIFFLFEFDSFFKNNPAMHSLLKNIEFDKKTKYLSKYALEEDNELNIIEDANKAIDENSILNLKIGSCVFSLIGNKNSNEYYKNYYNSVLLNNSKNSNQLRLLSNYISSLSTALTINNLDVYYNKEDNVKQLLINFDLFSLYYLTFQNNNTIVDFPSQNKIVTITSPISLNSTNDKIDINLPSIEVFIPIFTNNQKQYYENNHSSFILSFFDYLNNVLNSIFVNSSLSNQLSLNNLLLKAVYLSNFNEESALFNILYKSFLEEVKSSSNNINISLAKVSAKVMFYTSIAYYKSINPLDCQLNCLVDNCLIVIAADQKELNVDLSISNISLHSMYENNKHYMLKTFIIEQHLHNKTIIDEIFYSNESNLLTYPFNLKLNIKKDQVNHIINKITSKDDLRLILSNYNKMQLIDTCFDSFIKTNYKTWTSEIIIELRLSNITLFPYINCNTLIKYLNFLSNDFKLNKKLDREKLISIEETITTQTSLIITLNEFYIFLSDSKYEFILSFEKVSLSLNSSIKNKINMKSEIYGLNLNFLVKHLLKQEFSQSFIFKFLNDYKLESSLIKKIGYVEIGYLSKLLIEIGRDELKEESDKLSNSIAYIDDYTFNNESKFFKINLSYLELNFCKDSISELLLFSNHFKQSSFYFNFINKKQNINYKKNKNPLENKKDKVQKNESPVEIKINKEKKEDKEVIESNEELNKFIFNLHQFKIYFFEGFDFDFTQNYISHLNDYMKGDNNEDIMISNYNTNRNTFINPIDESKFDSKIHIIEDHFENKRKMSYKSFCDNNILVNIRNQHKDYNNFLVFYLNNAEFIFSYKSNVGFNIDTIVNIETIELQDNISNSKFKKIFSKLENELSDQGKLLSLKAELRENDKDKTSIEVYLSISLSNINVLISQVSLDFLINYYSFYEKTITGEELKISNESEVDTLNNIKFNKTEESSIKDNKNDNCIKLKSKRLAISKFTLNFSYLSQSFKISKLTKQYVELLNLANISNMKVLFLSFNSLKNDDFVNLLSTLIEFYINDIKHNQLPTLLTSFSFIKPIINIADSFLNLVKEPYIHYKADKSITDGITIGVKSFLFGITAQTIFLGEKTIAVFQKSLGINQDAYLDKTSLYKRMLYMIDEDKKRYDEKYLK